MHWSITAVLALLLCLVPAAAAGTADSPEIEDDAEDGHPVADKDLVKVWIEETTVGQEEQAALWFRIETGGDFEHPPAFFVLHERYRIAFQLDGQGPDEWYVALSPTRADRVVEGRAVPGAGDEAVRCVIGEAPADAAAPIGDEVVVNATFDAANQFGCIVAYSALGIQPGASLTGLYVEHLLVTRGPVSGGDVGGDKIPYTVIETFDRAPDDGHAVYHTPSPAPEVNATEEGGNGTVAGNGTMAGGAGSGGSGAADSGGGTAGSDDEDDGAGDPAGNEALDDGADKESPGAGWLLPVVATLLVAVVRRR